MTFLPWRTVAVLAALLVGSGYLITFGTMIGPVEGHIPTLLGAHEFDRDIDWCALHGRALDGRYDGQVHPDDLGMVKNRLWDKCVGQETAQWGDGTGVGADALLGGGSSG